MAITAAEPPAHYNTSLGGPITETEAPMPDYGSGTFLLSNIANSSSHSQGSGSDDVFQWNPGDGAPVEDHDADAGASIRDGTSNTVLLAEDHLPAVQGVGTATDTDWLLV